MNPSKLETASTAEVLAALEPVVETLLAEHEARRPLWFPSELLAAPPDVDPEKHRHSLQSRARGIGAPARAAMALNLLTEEGLPHFHRLLATHLDANAFWSKWIYLWTAEEDRHGAVLHDYVRDSQIFDLLALEKMQFAYLRAGFDPAWAGDPYRLFVYTTLQERATQVSHGNVGKQCAAEEPTVAAILRKVASEEARHFTFYRTVFGEILARDPNRALAAAAQVMPGIDMPGVSMPQFRDLAEVVLRAEIYGPRDYLTIVREQIDHWRIGTLVGLNSIGRAAQDKIMAIPERIERLAIAIDSRLQRRSATAAQAFAQHFAPSLGPRGAAG